MCSVVAYYADANMLLNPITLFVVFIRWVGPGLLGAVSPEHPRLTRGILALDRTV